MCEESENLLPTSLAARRRSALLKKRQKPRKNRKGLIPKVVKFVNEAILSRCTNPLTITAQQQEEKISCDSSSEDNFKRKSLFETLEKAYGDDFLATYLKKCASAISGGISARPCGLSTTL